MDHFWTSLLSITTGYWWNLTYIRFGPVRLYLLVSATVLFDESNEVKGPSFCSEQQGRVCFPEVCAHELILTWFFCNSLLYFVRLLQIRCYKWCSCWHSIFHDTMGCYQGAVEADQSPLGTPKNSAKKTGANQVFISSHQIRRIALHYQGHLATSVSRCLTVRN